MSTASTAISNKADRLAKKTAEREAVAAKRRTEADELKDRVRIQHLSSLVVLEYDRIETCPCLLC